MPKLDLTIPAEALSDGDQQELARELGATLLRWEGAPDTEFFRSITWAHVHAAPGGVDPDPRRALPSRTPSSTSPFRAARSASAARRAWSRTPPS